MFSHFTSKMQPEYELVVNHILTMQRCRRWFFSWYMICCPLASQKYTTSSKMTAQHEIRIQTQFKIQKYLIRQDYRPIQKQEKISNQENYHHIFSSNHLCWVLRSFISTAYRQKFEFAFNFPNSMHLAVFSSNFYGTNNKERERKMAGISIKINEP